MDDCPRHPDLLPYEVHDEDGFLFFNTSQEAEYPWKPCRAMAQGYWAQWQRQHPSPRADMPFDERTAVLSGLKSATRGFQSDDVASRAAAQVLQIAETMRPEKEMEHLKWLLRRVCLRGTDVKMTTAAQDGSQSILTPYPAYRWKRKTRLSFPWSNEQHINVLEEPGQSGDVSLPLEGAQQQYPFEQVTAQSKCGYPHVRMPAVALVDH